MMDTCLSFNSNRCPMTRTVSRSPGLTVSIIGEESCISRDMYTTTGDGSVQACARMPACVTVFARQCMTSPCLGQHSRHSISSVNAMFPAVNVPTVCDRRVHELGFTNPSGMHLPLIWVETYCVSCSRMP